MLLPLLSGTRTSLLRVPERGRRRRRPPAQTPMERSPLATSRSASHALREELHSASIANCATVWRRWRMPRRLGMSVVGPMMTRWRCPVLSLAIRQLASCQLNMDLVNPPPWRSLNTCFDPMIQSSDPCMPNLRPSQIPATATLKAQQVTDFQKVTATLKAPLRRP